MTNRNAGNLGQRIPTEVEYLITLAERQQSAGQLAEAAATYHKVLAINPDYAEAHNDLGNVYCGRGKFAEAQPWYERAVVLRPGLFQAHNNLGNLLARQRKFDQAIACYEQALALAPNFAEAHNNLGNVLKVRGELDRAEQCYRTALRIKPDYADAHQNLGHVLNQRGRLEEAAACYEQVLALAPNHAAAHDCLANIRRQQGNFEAAAAHYDRALQLNPEFAAAHYDRSEIKTFSLGDADLAKLQRLAAEPGRLHPSQMHFIHFALGKALEDVGEYPLAFEQWLKANKLKRQTVRHDEAGELRAMRRILELFDARLLNRFQAVGDPSSIPIFILGMPRSGSTLVEQILASHPQVHGGGELRNLALRVGSMFDTAGWAVPHPVSVSDLDADRLRRLGRDYLAHLPLLPDGKSRITDKSPGNFWYVGLIHLMLPGARIIHTVRNPVDTCISCFSKLFASGQTFSNDLAELGRAYRAIAS